MDEMDEDNFWGIIIILGLIFYFWIKFEEKRKEEERSEKLKEEKRLFDEESELVRTEMLKLQSVDLPWFIKKAIQEFESEYRAKGGSFFKREEISPLKYYGYVVGKTKVRREDERRRIMHVTYYSELPTIFPSYYRDKWGEPGTFKRYERINKHIHMLSDQRRNDSRFDVAVDHWDNDSSWFYDEYNSVALKRKSFGM
jgi:hypothetical protein